MRRPPDKEGNSAMTERDVVSSNATLNAFLGGSRQKSWMIAGGAPVRPTPRRPSITKPSDQPNANNPQRTSTTTLLSPVTSDESSSPGLAQNSVPLQNTHTASLSGTQGSSRVNATIATSQALQEACITPSNPDIVQPRVFPDVARGEPDEPCTVSISARPPLSEEISQLQTSANITSTGNSPKDSLHRSSSDPNTRSRVPSVTTRNSEIFPAIQGQVEQTMLSHTQRPQRRPSFRPTMPSLKPRAEMVKKYIEQYGLFCVWDTSRKDITGITELPDSVTLSHAFRILGQLIRDNEGMAPNHLRWFANFPSPFADLMKNSEPYRRIVQEVGTFLSKLVSNWSELTRMCASRGHPPLVDELINELGLLSPTLQNIVFTATRRNLNIVDDEYGNEMEKVFEQDKTGHRELAARYNTSRPPSEKEIQERTKTIVQRYMVISLKSRQKMLTNMAPQPSTTAPATPSSTGQIPRIPSGPYPPIGSSFNSNQNNPQQNHVQNRQTGQTLSQIRTSFTRPSSPLIIASASSIHQNIAPRTGIDTPSAIPIQALSMESPIQQGFQYSSPILRSNGTPFPPLALQRNQGPPPYPRAMTFEEQECIRYRNISDPMKRSFIPPLGFTHPQGIPDPDMKALHQANLRSPRLVTIDIPNLGCDGVSRRFYQFVKDFPMAPTKIPFESSLNKLEFQISADALTHISRDKLVANDCLMVREVKSQSLQFRLRCVSAVPDSNDFPLSRWVVSDTVWPEMIFMDIDSHELEARRKWHHGRDLPIDITPYVNAGANEISISMPKLPTATKEKEYFLAVEEIEILQHNEIMDMCKEQSIPAATVLEDIKKKLAGPTDDDDELLILVTDLSIGLTDPFTSRIFEIPVRGKNCLHRECFDLATFLSTRPSKPKRPDQPCMVDVWKCPLCSEDARPYSLRHDEFLASVRDELQQQDKLDAKSILVAADGTWRPKVESQPSHKRKSITDDDDDDSIDEERPRKKSTNDAKHAVIEIIELDDD
ncbi:MIZ/SP-RING zinc finger protein [Botrytis cinerea]